MTIFRRLGRRALSPWLLLLVVAGCGETDKTVRPAPVNPFAAGKVGSDTTLEIMTWNIENFAKAGDATIGLVRDAVAGLDVDIVAVQEIASGVEFDRLVAALAGWDGVRATSDRYQNLGFLYRTGGGLVVASVYEILAAYSTELPRTPYVLEATWNGVDVVVINNHYKCCGDGTIGSDEWDEEVRRRDASVLLHDFVEANFAGRNVLIVGDLNDELTDPAANNVFAVFLDDPADWRFADLAIAQDLGALWSYPSYNSHLDHILVTSPLFAALDDPAAMVEVVPLHAYVAGGWSIYDRNVSDHLPVVLRIAP